MNQKFWSAWKWKNLTWRWGNMQWRGCKVTQPACYITVEVPVQHEYAKIHEKLRKVQEGLLRLRPLPSTVLRPWLRLLSTHCKCLGHKRLPNMLWCMLCKSSSIWAPLFHYTYTWGCHKPDNSCCLNLLSHLDSVREKLPRKYIDPPWPIFFVHSSLKGCFPSFCQRRKYVGNTNISERCTATNLWNWGLAASGLPALPFALADFLYQSVALGLYGKVHLVRLKRKERRTVSR